MAKATTLAIGVIETEYRNIRFRSRLEARWAVLFDEWGKRWEFEPEGYSDGRTRYLPDFWLPDMDCFWEVKRDLSSMEDQELDRALEKAQMLVEQSGKGCMISFGFPQDIYDTEGKVLIFLPDGSDLIQTFASYSPEFHDAAYEARGYRFWDPS